ncbi:hypothetical protein Y1Q_0008025 [Alligator mississippiensis]|uniref:Uncharacterized protein n=1 Tax=Alligator mississippiensis TaxID=8496 RepID=A0A151NFA3_ALLMI|nr:hypothetical protein Y1Q_0008025 [Alligator mississippiensis]
MTVELGLGDAGKVCCHDSKMMTLVWGSDSPLSQFLSASSVIHGFVRAPAAAWLLFLWWHLYCSTFDLGGILRPLLFPPLQHQRLAAISVSIGFIWDPWLHERYVSWLL